MRQCLSLVRHVAPSLIGLLVVACASDSNGPQGGDRPDAASGGRGGAGRGGAGNAGRGGGGSAGRTADVPPPADAATATSGDSRPSDAAADAPPAADAAAVADAAGSRADAPAPGALFVYAQVGRRVQPYEVDRQTGALTRKGNGVEACEDPVHLQVDPAQTRVYVACRGGKALTVLPINAATGELSRKGSATAGGDAVHVGVHPSGKFAVTSNYGGSVTLFEIANDGGPTARGTVGVGEGEIHAARFDRTGKFVYVASAGGNRILQYAFDQAKPGELKGLSPASVTVVTNETGGMKQARHMEPSVDGKTLFVMAQRPAFLVSFGIDAGSGRLTKLGSGVSALDQAAANEPPGKDVAVAPNGKHVYATVCRSPEGRVAGFEIDAKGAAVFKEVLPSGGDCASQVTVDPEGQFLFVVHQADRPSVAVFELDAATGKMTKAGNPTTIGDGNAEGVIAVSLPR